MTDSNRQKIMSTEYLDPLGFLLDNSMTLLKMQPDHPEVNVSQPKSTLVDNKKLPISVKDSSSIFEEKLNNDIKDVSEFMSSVVSGLKLEEGAEKQITIGNEFIENLANIFEKFKVSTVIETTYFVTVGKFMNYRLSRCWHIVPNNGPNC